MIVGASETVKEIEGIVSEWDATRRNTTPKEDWHETTHRANISDREEYDSGAGIETMSERSRAGGPTKASGPRIGVGALSGRLRGSGAVGEEVNDGRSIESIEVVS